MIIKPNICVMIVKSKMSCTLYTQDVQTNFCWVTQQVELKFPLAGKVQESYPKLSLSPNN